MCGSQQHNDNNPESPARRRFLVRLTVAAGAVSAAALLAPAAAFVFSPRVLDDPDDWRPVGPVEQFPVGATVIANYLDTEILPWAGFAAESAVFIRRLADDRITAFSIYCTHTGCPVRWIEGARQFLCPCHGGAFHEDGRVAAGPPPRPLVQFAARVRDGMVEVRPAPVVPTD
jgi:menaquinol-cytochrome c reductase iron-sulfur subunit